MLSYGKNIPQKRENGYMYFNDSDIFLPGEARDTEKRMRHRETAKVRLHYFLMRSRILES